MPPLKGDLGLPLLSVARVEPDIERELAATRPAQRSGCVRAGW